MRRYFFNLLYAIDHLFNVLLLNGSPDVCISANAYKHHPRLAKFINFITRNPNHCRNAWIWEDYEN